MHLLQFQRVACRAVGQSHRLHILFCKHIAQRSVLIHRQHLAQVVGVVQHTPLFASVLPECQVERVILSLQSQQRRAQPAATNGVCLSRRVAEVKQVVFFRQR